MNNLQKNGFKDFSVCECHAHLLFDEHIDNTVKAFQNELEYYEFEKINLCALVRDADKAEDVLNNAKAFYCKSKINTIEKPDQCYVYGNVYHYLDERDTAEEYLNQAKNLYDMGVDGYKMLEGKPEFRKLLGKRLDDQIFDLMYSFIEEKGMPIVMHVGDPARNWDITKISPTALERGWYYDETFPTLEQLREEVNGILKKFPKLKLCLAHFYFLGYELESAKNLLESWENVALDLTPGGEMFVGFSQRHDEWRKFFTKYADRIYFGTDLYNVYFENLDDYEEVMPAGHRINLVRKALEKSEDFEDMHFGTIKPLNLDDAVLQKIYHDNFVNLHGNSRKIDKKLIAGYINQLTLDLEKGKLKLMPEKFDLDMENLRILKDYFNK